MRLEDVYKFEGPQAALVLYHLLQERTPSQSISHKKMPTFAQHREFYLRRPYLAWYFIKERVLLQEEILGAIYLSKAREIGIFLFKGYQNKGYAKKAIELLMKKHPGKFLANINPKNSASIKLFTEIGFKHIQNTYIL